MITGDTVHSSAQIDEPEMAFMFDNDPATARPWRDRILAEVATEQGKRYWTIHDC